jgi:diguanylate cyclase (GGDEF)-like protein/PAS domain S-box-containing protein
VERLNGDPRHRDFWPALAGGAGYLLLAWGTIFLTSDGHNVSAIWPANALLLAIVLPLPARRWPLYFIAALAGNMLANYLSFGTLIAPILYGLNNLSEVLVAALLLQRLGARGNPLENVPSIARFALFACIAPAITATAGAATAHYIFGQPYWASYRIWYLADALGLLIFTPLFLGIRSGEMMRWLREIGPRGRIEAVALLGIVMLCAFFVFRSDGYPMLFVMNAPILLATFRLGQFGTKIGLIVVALIGLLCTMSGLGPIASLIADRGGQALFLQFYLGVMLLSTLPVAAELNARRALARRLAESEASLRLLASESADALVRLDERGRCIQSSGAITMLLGAEMQELLGTALPALVDPRDSMAMQDSLNQALYQPGTVTYAEFRPRDRCDDWLECTLRALVDQEGRSFGVIGAIRDITIRKEREVSLALAASSDSLTGALNHAAFMAHLDRALAHLTSSHLALIMVDIDHFKQVNDRHGHLAGDHVLVEAHIRLRALLRDQDVIGRLGGDELAILVDGTAEDLAVSIAEAIRIAISEKPITFDGGSPLAISVSCGVAQAYPGIGRENLMRKADEALYQAKAEGRDRVVISTR